MKSEHQHKQGNLTSCKAKPVWILMYLRVQKKSGIPPVCTSLTWWTGILLCHHEKQEKLQAATSTHLHHTLCTICCIGSRSKEKHLFELLDVSGLSCPPNQSSARHIHHTRASWAQQLGLTGVVTPLHVGSSWIREQTHLPCIGRRILHHEPPGKPQYLYFLN